MKIIEFIPSLKNRAGAEVFAVSLACELSKTNEVTILTMYDDINDGFLKQINESKIVLVSCGIKTKKNFSCIDKLKRNINRLKPDVIHTHLSAINFLFFAFPFASKKWRIVHTLHNIPEKETNKVGIFVRKKMIRKSNVSFVAISDTNLELSTKFYKNKIELIYNGAKLFSKMDAPKKYDFICVARFMPQKNHMRLIRCFNDIFELNNNIKLICVGDGPLMGSCKEYANSLNCKNNILFYGSTDNVSPLLNESKIFVLSSNYEGNPISILEAMSVGLPVVSPCVGGIPDIIKNGENGYLFDPNDENGLFEALNSMMNSENFSDFCTKNENISKRFTIEHCANEYLQLFERK